MRKRNKYDSKRKWNPSFSPSLFSSLFSRLLSSCEFEAAVHLFFFLISHEIYIFMSELQTMHRVVKWNVFDELYSSIASDCPSKRCIKIYFFPLIGLLHNYLPLHTFKHIKRTFWVLRSTNLKRIHLQIL